jgi:cytochrome c oxidase subunit 4
MAKTPLQHASAQHHVVSTATSIKVLVTLAVLMVLTIGASYMDVGIVVLNNVIAMAIACIKAILVMTYFMGLKWATPLTRLWAVAGFIIFSLMFIILFDYNTRSNEIAPSWDGRPEPATPRVVDPKGQSVMPDPVDHGFRPRS